MIPLRDNNPTRTFPIVTIALIAVNVLVFVLQPSALKSYYEMIPADVVHNANYVGWLRITSAGTHFHPASLAVALSIGPNALGIVPVLPTIQPAWLTIFTAMFLHANLLHIGGNMLFLWIFGNNVEDALGKFRYLLFYFACGLVAALAQIAVDPNSHIPTLGASGAIAGVLGAYIVLFPGARVLTLITALFIWFLREISALWVIGLWFVLQVFEGLNGASGGQVGGVAYFAHIGGFAAGIIGVLVMGGRRLGAGRMRTSKYRER